MPAKNILLIRPAHFGFNTETAASNSFQHRSEGNENALAQKALAEFNNFAHSLQQHGLNTFIFDDTAAPLKPDAVFPNNWVSFHSDGTVVLYPMQATNRRAERRQDIIDTLAEKFRISNIIDLSHYEQQGKFLEGTGSIVFDHDNHIAYASLSPRTSEELLRGLCDTLAYRPVIFRSFDTQGQAIYHTNVMMSIAPCFALVCSSSITDAREREAVLDSLRSTGHEIIEITPAQMNSFAGNMLAVQSNAGQEWLVLSQTAFKALDEVQLEQIIPYAQLLPIAINTIEQFGGGSARCVMAEIFLPCK